MSIIDELGMTKEEMIERIVAGAVDRVLLAYGVDEDGDETERQTQLAKRLEKRAKQAIDKAVEGIAQRHVFPGIAQMVENLSLQLTNQWGEKRGATVTFLEYLTSRADSYLREEVNCDGKTREEAQGYTWKSSGTRVAFLVHRHLQYSIQTAMQEALVNANSSIVGGIEAAVKIKLREVADSMSVKVTTKS